jgi:DNA-binding transcriptional LysR family regulator
MNAIDARLSDAKAEIDALARGVAAPLRVGTFESVGTRLLPEIIGRFGELFPDVRVEVEDAILDLELLRLLERGAYDLVFANLPLPPGPFETEVVLNDPWVLVCRADSELAQSPDPPTLQEISELSLVTFRSPRAIEPATIPLRAAGVELNLAFQSDYNEVVQGFAAAGLGVALMPRLAVNPQEERTAIIELGELVPARQIAIICASDRPRSEAMDAFIGLASRVGSRVEDADVTSAESARPGAFDGAERMKRAS